MDVHALVRAALAGQVSETAPAPKPLAFHTLEYAAWRLAHASRQPGEPGPDHAVLLRQVARWHEGGLFVGSLPDGLVSHCERAGVSLTPSGHLDAAPFVPDWLGDDPIDRQRGIDERPAQRKRREDVLAEAFLSSIKYRTWQSQAQKEAAWTVLTAGAGTTTLVTLPTGTGKSLCFQLLSRFGSGLTVVVVPTVALALDQWRSANDQLGGLRDLNPQYYAADDPLVEPQAVADAITNGRTRLVFASPEACVSGRLRHALGEAARAGRFENLVVDEAHIIETWGMYFRVDFQMLGTLRRQWVGSSEGLLRTFLFSATFTPRSRQVLERLFGGGPWQEFRSQRLRPELVYYARGFSSEADRERAVRECAWRLPRPAIFYTTEVKEAERFAGILREEEGFRRVGCFHGETPTSERRALLERWRSDDIDLMVATSAFGLGVDKQDVRAVLHACHPESVHRYYQEVGRGGRDGASAVCLLLPTEHDASVAARLTPKLLREETVQKRWEALWQTREEVASADRVWRLRTDSRHVDLLGTRTWEENVRWNRRLILQLVRAGLLEIQDIEYRSEEGEADRTEWLKVELRFSPTSSQVGALIKRERDEEQAIAAKGLDDIAAYVDSGDPLCSILRRLYGTETQRTCAGCPGCRRKGRAAVACPPLKFELVPSTAGSLVVVAEAPNPFEPREVQTFKRLVRRAIEEKGIRRFACLSKYHERLLGVFGEALSPKGAQVYRVDSLDGDTPFGLGPDEQLIVFHFERVDDLATSLTRGREVIHVMTREMRLLDENGRYPLESCNARLVHGLDAWLQGR